MGGEDCTKPICDVIERDWRRVAKKRKRKLRWYRDLAGHLAYAVKVLSAKRRVVRTSGVELMPGDLLRRRDHRPGFVEAKWEAPAVVVTVRRHEQLDCMGVEYVEGESLVFGWFDAAHVYTIERPVIRVNR